MNPYTTTGEARIQPHDIEFALSIDRFMGGGSLAALERQRGWQAEAELDWLLTQNGRNPHSAASLALLLRQTIGTALVQAGERLAGGAGRGASPTPSGMARALKTT